MREYLIVKDPRKERFIPKELKYNSLIIKLADRNYEDWIMKILELFVKKDWIYHMEIEISTIRKDI